MGSFARVFTLQGDEELKFAPNLPPPPFSDKSLDDCVHKSSQNNQRSH